MKAWCTYFRSKYTYFRRTKRVSAEKNVKNEGDERYESALCQKLQLNERKPQTYTILSSILFSIAIRWKLARLLFCICIGRATSGLAGMTFSSRHKLDCYPLKSSECLCFWSANRESLKELIYQKKNGGHIYVSHQNNHQLSVSEHYISHNMFDRLVFLMVLCASTKKKLHFSVLATVSDTVS